MLAKVSEGPLFGGSLLLRALPRDPRGRPRPWFSQRRGLTVERSPGGSVVPGCAPAPCPQFPALGETQGQAARLRPGMQPARAAPCPNQFEPAAGMEPWRVPTSSLWRPSRAPSCGSGLPPGSPPRVRAAAPLPAWGWGCQWRPGPQGPLEP